MECVELNLNCILNTTATRTAWIIATVGRGWGTGRRGRVRMVRAKVNQWRCSRQFNISAGQGAYLINYSAVKQVASGEWQAASGKRRQAVSSMQHVACGRRQKSRASNAKSRVIILHLDCRSSLVAFWWSLCAFFCTATICCKCCLAATHLKVR